MPSLLRHHLISVEVFANNLLPLTHDKHKTIVNFFFKEKKLYVLVRNTAFGSRGSKIELLGKP